MNILLWVLQVFLALAFAAHGWLLLAPPASMIAQMNATLPRWFQIFLGGAEVLAAERLTLPAITRIQPWPGSPAAAGIIVVMGRATRLPLMPGGLGPAPTTPVLLAMATFVAYMRFTGAPIQREEVAPHGR